MDNYVYIVAGLPELVLDFNYSTFNYENTKQLIYDQLSVKDRQLVDLLEEGFDETRLNASFYERTQSSKNPFIRSYFFFDLQFRNMKVNYLSRRLERKADNYLIDYGNVEFEEEKIIQQLFENEDFVMREQQIDTLKWKKANEITGLQYFNINIILAFLIKAKIVHRWAVLDSSVGEKLFKQLVNEVRGTYQGIN